ncbi:MAG TPA: hypothetical protein VK983_02575 [Candidatus Limnocylindrales bacterium]|nr:hypothetical protein [Candidatus Limnocylindrales bacterium]
MFESYPDSRFERPQFPTDPNVLASQIDDVSTVAASADVYAFLLPRDQVEATYYDGMPLDIPNLVGIEVPMLDQMKQDGDRVVLPTKYNIEHQVSGIDDEPISETVGVHSLSFDLPHPSKILRRKPTHVSVTLDARSTYKFKPIE